MAMRRDLESNEKLPKLCHLAEDDSPVAFLRPILETTESPRRANRIVTADSVQVPLEETAPTKAAGSRNFGFNETVRGTTSRRDAESLLRSKQKPLPAGPAGRTRETATDIVVTTANGGPVPSIRLPLPLCLLGLPCHTLTGKIEITSTKCTVVTINLFLQCVSMDTIREAQTQTESCTRHTR